MENVKVLQYGTDMLKLKISGAPVPPATSIDKG